MPINNKPFKHETYTINNHTQQQYFWEIFYMTSRTAS